MADTKKTWFARNWGILTLVVLVLIVGIGYTVVSVGNSEKLSAQTATISDLRAKLKSAEEEKAEKEAESIKNAVGLDVQRKAEDDEMFAAFMENVATWTNGEEYDKGRNIVINDYHIPEDSQFLTTYFPKQPSKNSASGDTYYKIDIEGLNSHLDSIESSIINIDGNDYTYLALVKIKSASTDGKSDASNTSLIRYTTNGDGKIISIDGTISNDDMTD